MTKIHNIDWDAFAKGAGTAGLAAIGSHILVGDPYAGIVIAIWGLLAVCWVIESESVIADRLVERLGRDRQ